MSTNRRPPLGGFLGLSLLAHLHLALMLAAFFSFNPDGCRGEDLDLAPLEVSLVPEDEVQREDDKRIEEAEQEEKKEEEKERDIKGQVVDLPPPLEEKQPDKAKFLSEYDSSVKRETKGPQSPMRQGRVLADRPLPPVKQRPRPSTQERKQVEKKVLKLAMRTKPELPRSRLEQSEQGDEPAQAPPRPPQKGPRGPQQPDAAPNKQVKLNDLKLSDKELMKALGSRANDYLKDVPEGKSTLLNSKRWRFASFFNRVKRRVAQNWHPDVVYRRRDPSGNVYGFRDRLTILRVHLTPKGKLKDLHLEKPSGVGFLDDEAMSAFRAAEPFPNPPRGLVDKESGVISFRFGFLFEISRRPSFRVFRNN